MARGGGRDGAPLVRHRPQHGPNAIADYIQQSIEALAPQEPLDLAPKRRRQRQRKKTSSSSAPGPTPAARLVQARRVCVRNLLSPQELEDEDEYADIVADLHADFERFGVIAALAVDRVTGDVVVEYEHETHAAACVEAKHGHRYGGRELVVTLECHDQQEHDAREEKPRQQMKLPVAVDDGTGFRPKTKRKRRSKIKNAVIRAQAGQSKDLAPRGVLVRSMVEADEVACDDEYEDVVSDVTDVLSRHGEIIRLTIVRERDADAYRQPGDVVVEFVDETTARAAFESLHDSKYGGRTLTCTWVETPQRQEATVYVDGVLDPNELQDDDEYDDVCEEVEGFLRGAVDGWDEVWIARESGQVALRFIGPAAAAAAVETLTLKSYGGKRLVVRLHQPSEILLTLAAQTSEKPVNTKISIPAPQVSDALVTMLVAFVQRLASLQVRIRFGEIYSRVLSHRLVGVYLTGTRSYPEPAP
jgi:RNA recognition motif-containing protein